MDFIYCFKQVNAYKLLYGPSFFLPILHDQRNMFEDGLGGIRGVFQETVIVS